MIIKSDNNNNNNSNNNNHNNHNDTGNNNNNNDNILLWRSYIISTCFANVRNRKDIYKNDKKIKLV